MYRRFVEGERVTVRRMESIARIARELQDALTDGDLDAAGKLIGEEGRLRYSLAPSVATDALRHADRAARKAGALGVKVCGAGGGGCLVAFAAAGRTESVARAIEATGAASMRSSRSSPCISLRSKRKLVLERSNMGTLYSPRACSPSRASS